MQKSAVLALLVVLGALAPGLALSVPAPDAPQPSAALSRELGAMVQQLLAGGNAGARQAVRRPDHSIQFEGVGWQSAPGVTSGTSHLGLLLDQGVTSALGARALAAPGDAGPGSKGVGRTIVRGGFQVLKEGVRVSLTLVDANSGHVLSTSRRMLGSSSLAGIALHNFLPPDTASASTLSALVQQSLGRTASAFPLRVRTDRGGNAAYFEGEPLHLMVDADRDCYVRLYHMSWSERTLTLIYPNRSERSGFLRAGEALTVPPQGSSATFEISKPYGVDAIIAIGSVTPFADEADVQAAFDAPAEVTGGLGSRGVVRAGTYLAQPKLDAEGAKGVLAKGLFVRIASPGGSAEAPAVAEQPVAMAENADPNGAPAPAPTSDPYAGAQPEAQPAAPAYAQDNGAPAPGAHSTTRSGGLAVRALPVGAGGRDATLARAACYYTTLPRLFDKH